MEKQVMVQIDHISKEYRLGAIGGTTLREDLARLGARIRKKEDPTLKLGQTSQHYGERFLALDDISFTVYKGEAVGIIGHNGAGKSTLLKLISQVTAPTRGQIGLNGRVASMLEVGTGFHPELTGRENIYMNGAILGMTRVEIDRKIEQIIDFSECREFIDTPVKRYSSGMYVKLAFSVAAHLDSEIMIMDEVLAVGDMKFQQKCLNRMGDAANEEGRTVLYVSHNMSTIRKFCTRCVVLDRGKLIYDGDVEPAIEVYTEAAMDRTKTYFDISKIFQRYLSPFPKAKMCTVQLINKDTAVYDLNEPVIFDLMINARESVNSASLRFEVRGSDESSVGTAFALHFGKLEPGENRYRFTMTTMGIVPGKYRVVLGLFDVNSAGAYSDIDVVERAIGFEIMDKDEHLGINWLGKFWGHLKFNNLLIENRS